MTARYSYVELSRQAAAAANVRDEKDAIAAASVAMRLRQNNASKVVFRRGPV